MLTIVVADAKPFRTARVAAVLKVYAASEVIVLDDTFMSVADLEQYLYPSLFSVTAPVVHTRFILDAKEKDLTADLLKKLMASPTVFLFEELALSKPFLTTLKKQGIEIHSEEPTKKASKDNLFGAIGFVTLSSKKDRWMAYQQAIAQYPVEAILGMLYWKVKDMVLKERDANGPYHVLYTKLLEAHALAWQEGTPLALAIEKTLLLY